MTDDREPTRFKGLGDPKTTMDRSTRRRYLVGLGTALTAGLAGCNDTPAGGPANGTDASEAAMEFSTEEFRGSGPLAGTRPPLEGPSIEDLPDLDGELTIYIGGGEGGLYTQLLDKLTSIYPEFSTRPRRAPSTQLANTIVDELEGGNSPADVFWAIDAGSLGLVADADGTLELPSDTVDPVPDAFHPDDQWVGVAGRARSVPYNTNTYAESDIPDDVMTLPETGSFDGNIGWAPTYSAFQAFVTAMRVLEGESATRSWLEGMQEYVTGSHVYPDEFLVSNAVADGSIGAGFANHYYALRVKAARPDAPIDVAFTSGDAGTLVNTAGVGTIRGTEKRELAETLVAHLLTVEAQEFFATRTFAYPMIPGVPPVGGLPAIDELSPPSLELGELSDVGPTIELMRDVGVL